MNVAEMTPDQALEFSLRTILEKSYESSYHSNWRDELVENYGYDADDFEEDNLTEWNGPWDLFREHAELHEVVIADNGISVTLVGTESTGEAQATDAYFVVIRLIDDSGTRYFMRDGYYSSYGESSLGDSGESREVFPRQETITVWRANAE
jgi:FMN phosphatase YigB (HAD superfamily)